MSSLVKGGSTMMFWVAKTTISRIGAHTPAVLFLDEKPAQPIRRNMTAMFAG